MKKSTFVALALLWFFISVGFGARRIHFKRISLNDGLSQNAIFCALQDCKGFLWFGTQDGLNKYDGYNFTVYKLDPDNNNSLSHSWIDAIYEDDKGMIWIGTHGGGLNRFDPKKDRFFRYRVDPEDPDCIQCGLINAICQDTAGTIWIGTEAGGIYTLTREEDPDNPGVVKERIKNYRHTADDPKSLNSNTVNDVIKDRSGTIWIGTNRGLDKFDRKKGVFSHYVNIPGDPGSLSHNVVTRIYEDRSGLLWVGTNGGGINLLAKKTGLFSRYRHRPGDSNSLSHNSISSIIEDRSGVLWIGTRGGGLNKFNKRTETFTCYRNSPGDPHSVSYNYISCLFEDASRILWIGTAGKGLNKFDREDKFMHYKFSHDNPNSLNDNYVYSIYEDRSGILWIGTSGGGLNRLDRQIGEFSHFLHDPDNPGSLSRDMVRAIFEDSSGELWIGTGGGGLDRLDRKTGTFTHFYSSADNPDSLSHNTVYSIIEDSSGVLWIGTGGGGINKFNRESGTFTCYRRDEKDRNSLSDDSVTVIYEAPSKPGVLWIGTRNRGLNRFDARTGDFTRFEADSEDPGSLSFNFVLSLLEDKSGTLWIGTHGGGLNKVIDTGGSGERIKFAHYTERNGLSNNSIYGILEDSSGNLWMSTNKGISKFDPRSELFKNYNVKDGLQGSEFNGGAHHKNKAGEMFFGGINGFNVFSPADIKDNPYIPPIVITGFRIFNIPIPLAKDSPLKQAITWTESIDLFFTYNAISFEFAALDFTVPENNKYAYKMVGFDDEWNYTDSRKRFAYYTNLDPGKYTFRVRGSNNDGIWNNEGTSLKITVLPPFYGTWWFTMLLIFFGVVLLVFFIRMRTKRIEEKSRREKFELKREMERKQLEKELKLKADFTAMLVHDLRSPLSAVIGFSEILSETPEFVDAQGIGESIKLSSKKMLSLVNEMLDFAKFEAGKMVLDKKETDILRIMEENIELMNPLFDQKRIKLNYEVPAEMREERVIIDPEKISQVLNNFLSNAIKFAPHKGTVTLGICEVDKALVEVSVKDNGPGIPRDKQKYIFDKYAQLSNNEQIKGTGLGLAVSKMIIEAHGGTIGYRTAQNHKGSVFYFRLPV